MSTNCYLQCRVISNVHAMTPNDMHVTPDFQTLVVAWPDGTRSQLDARYLRRSARDAVSRRAMIDHGEISAPPGLMITALEPVGHGAVNIVFSDGHNRAIFPYPYLRTLAEQMSIN